VWKAFHAEQEVAVEMAPGDTAQERGAVVVTTNRRAERPLP
jgi:hypothetical protein